MIGPTRRVFLTSALLAAVAYRCNSAIRQAQAASSEAALDKPLLDLYTGLEAAMRAGRSTPFTQRFDALAPAVDQAFDLTTMLKVSVGLRWDSMDADDADAAADRVSPLHHRDLCRQLRQI